jgi:hypothetical protein
MWIMMRRCGVCSASINGVCTTNEQSLGPSFPFHQTLRDVIDGDAVHILYSTVQ